MDPISSLRASLPSSSLSSLEGSVESVDDKQHTVTVRVSGSESVVARGEGVIPGDRVQLARDAAGAWVARPVVRPETAVLADLLLDGWLASSRGSEVVRAARSGDPAQVRSALTALWSEIATTPLQDLPEDLQDSKIRGLPPLAALGARATGASSNAVAPLALREEISPGLYRAESAGRRLELSGPSGVRLGEAGLWAESQIGEVLSMWAPTSVERSVPPELPSKITADLSGARRILDSLGVPASSVAEDDESLKSLVRTLVRAEAILTESMNGRTEGTARGPVPVPSPAIPAPGSVSAPVAPASIPANPTAPASPASANPALPGGAPANPTDPVSRSGPSVETPGALVPAEALLDPSAIQVAPDTADPALSARAGGNPRVESHAPEVAARATSGAAIVATPGSVSQALVVVMPTASAPDSEASSKPVVPGTPVALPSRALETSPDVLARTGSIDSNAGVARELPAGLALRIVKAWAVSDGEPTDAVLRAAIGEYPELPEAAQRLAAALRERPEAFAAVAAFLQETAPEAPLLARHLGLDAPRAVPAPSVGNPAMAGRDLAQALVEDLGKALHQGRSTDASVLRDALGSLVAEGLDGARDPANPMGASPWLLPPREGRPDAGRVVVQDRRRSKDGSPERTVVDVSMNPTGLGGVDARLELRGQDLDVGFRVRDPATAAKIRENLPELRRILSELGLDPRAIDVKQGRDKPAKAVRAPRDSSGGLDIRA